MTDFEKAFTGIDKAEIGNNTKYKVSFETARVFHDALDEIYAYARHDAESVEGKAQAQIQSKLRVDWEILQSAVFEVTGYTPDELIY